MEFKMKKIILGVLVLTATNAMALSNNVNLYGKVGVDVVSKFETISPSVHKFNAPSKNKVAPGVFLEATYSIVPELEVGVGVGYIKRKSYNYSHLKSIIDDDNYGGAAYNVPLIEYSKVNRYSSIPLYFVGKFNLNLKPDLLVYLQGDFGYSFNKVKSTHRYVTYEDFFDNGMFRKNRDNIIHTDVTNGKYYGVGVGVEYKNIQLGISYHHSKARLQYHTRGLALTNDSYQNDALRLSLGYKF